MSFQNPKLTLLSSSWDQFICPFHKKSSLILSVIGCICAHNASPFSALTFLPWPHHAQSILSHTLTLRSALCLPLANNTEAEMITCQFHVLLNKLLTSLWEEHVWACPSRSKRNSRSRTSPVSWPESGFDQLTLRGPTECEINAHCYMELRFCDRLFGSMF